MELTEHLRLLSSETLQFAQLVKETPADDADLLHACTLFGSYLHHELDHINTCLDTEKNYGQIYDAASQLYRISDLVTPHPDSNSLNTHNWIRQWALFQQEAHRLELQQTAT